MMQTAKLQPAVYSQPPCKHEKMLNSYKTNLEIDGIYTRLSEFSLIQKNGQGFGDEHVHSPTTRNNCVKELEISSVHCISHHIAGYNIRKLNKQSPNIASSLFSAVTSNS